MSVMERILTVCVFVCLGFIAVLSADATNAKRNAKAQEDLAALYKKERDGWITAAEQRALDLQLATIRRAQAEESVRSLQERLATLGEQHAPARKSVRESRPEDDGPVAPVLRNALELLP